MLGWLAFIVAALTGLFVLFQNRSDALDAANAGFTAAAVIALLVALYFVSFSSGWGDRRGLRLVAVILALCTAGASAWWVASEHFSPITIVTPTLLGNDRARGAASGTVSVLIRRNPDGNFVTQGQINGTEATLLFDTGASLVMLKPTDAERAGIDLKSLSFTIPVQTANETVYAAPVRVRSIAIGLLKVDDVEALVARPGSLNENLLGMSFLRRLTSYNLSGDFLTLRE